jgi:hypothetical protein
MEKTGNVLIMSDKQKNHDTALKDNSSFKLAFINHYTYANVPI